jgi:hypothetical protein
MIEMTLQPCRIFTGAKFPSLRPIEDAFDAAA